MKNLKTINTVVLTLLISSLAMGQVAEKTLVKSFNLKGDKTILLDLDGEVDVQEWNGELLRIQINLSIENGTSAMLKSLILAGRYNLKGENKGGELIVSSPEMLKEVMIRGKKLMEDISYTIFTPSDVLVKIADESSTKLEDTGKTPASL